MKLRFFVLAMAFSIVTLSLHAQSLSNATQQYIQLKNALASDNAVKASATAVQLQQQLSKVKKETLNAKVRPVFAEQEKILLKESVTIAKTKDISTQRKSFMLLSNSMIALAKAGKISTATLYEQYCPMKKAYWLSTTSEITNPYYGKDMYDCGKVTAHF